MMSMDMTAHAVPANPTPQEVTQADGTIITIIGRGDEFFNWVEDENGYIIAFDPETGNWCYAYIADGLILPGPLVVGGERSASSDEEILLDSDDPLDAESPQDKDDLLDFGDLSEADNQQDTDDPLDEDDLSEADNQQDTDDPQEPDKQETDSPQYEERQQDTNIPLDIDETKITIIDLLPLIREVDRTANTFVLPGGGMSLNDMSSSSDSSSSPLISSTTLLPILIEFADTHLSRDIVYWHNHFFVTMDDYFNEVSGSLFKFTPLDFTRANGTITSGLPAGVEEIQLYNGVARVRLSVNHPKYIDGDTGNTDRIQNEIQKAFNAAKAYVNFSQFGSNLLSGHIRCTDFSVYSVIAGWERSNSVNTAAVTGQRATWAHARSGSIGGTNVSVRFSDATLVSNATQGEIYTGSAIGPSATVMGLGATAHELFHTLGLPDLYSYLIPSGGIGGYCIMASGSWGAVFGGTPGYTPTHPNAWAKVELRYVTPKTLSHTDYGSFDVRNFATGNHDILKVINPIDPAQYYLIENRQQIGYDLGLRRSTIQSGVLIIHVDERVRTAAGNRRINDNNFHKTVEIERLPTDTSVQTDPFYRSGGVNLFDNATTPSSKFHSGMSAHTTASHADCCPQTVVSGIRIKVNSASGPTMNVEVGFGIPSHSPKNVNIDPNGSVTLTIGESANAVEGKSVFIQAYTGKTYTYDSLGYATPEINKASSNYRYVYTFTSEDAAKPAATAFTIDLSAFTDVLNSQNSLSNDIIAKEFFAFEIEVESAAFSGSGNSSARYFASPAFFAEKPGLPSVSSTTPEDGATGAAIEGTISIMFNRQMDKRVTGTVTLNDSIPTTDGAWSADGMTYTVNYPELESTTTYTLYISGFADPDGNVMAENNTRSFTTVSPAPGAAVRSAPVKNSVTFNSITVDEVSPVAANPGEQTVEYAISRATLVPVAGWQEGLTFNNLLPSTGYYVFARTAAKGGYDAGPALRSTIITTTQEPFAITLSRAGTFTFGAANFGYGTRTATTVTIRNTGASATGELKVSLSGEDASFFQLSRTSVPSLARNGSASFTVRPVNGLLVGTHTATVNVSSDNVSERSFNVTFTVNKGTAAGAAISGRPEADGNSTTSSITVKPVTNAGLTGQAVQYAITTSTANKAPAIGWQESPTFNGLRHSTAYHVWARTAANNNYNAGPAQRTVSMITTAKPETGINLHIGNAAARVVTHNFGSANQGYSERSTATVRVVNASNSPTGEMEIQLSGPDASSFEIVSPSTAQGITPKLPSIDAGNRTTFTIRPVHRLRGGLHEATVTVSGLSGVGFSESFRVIFNVGRVAGATINERPTVLPVEEKAPSSSSITVKELTVPSSNGQTVQYAITRSTSNKAPASGWQDEPVFNNLDHTTAYHVWARSAPNNNNNAGPAQRTVTAIRTEGITINRSGTLTFSQTAFNVSRAAVSTQINNPGRGNTGDMTISLTGADADSFMLTSPSIKTTNVEMTEITIEGIASRSNATFSVGPKHALDIGTYRATVIVGGSDLPARSFNVSFRVVRGAGAALNDVPTVAQDGVTFNSISVEPITLSHPGNQEVQYAITTSTSKKMPSGLKWQTSPDFIGLRPMTRYHVWARTALNANCNTGTARRSEAITTDAMPHCITLSSTGTHTFPTAAFNYRTSRALSVTVRNVGTSRQATGILDISLTGPDADSFVIVSPATGKLASINYNATRSFTVRPKPGLAAATYTATVDVSGANGISESFNVSFSVTGAAGATVSNIPVVSSITANSITVTAVTIPLNPGAQKVEYAISTLSTPTTEALNAFDWQESCTFDGLNPSTTYYVFARSAANSNFKSGVARRSLAIRTGASEYGIALDKTGEFMFPTAVIGYGTRPALQITTSNTGVNSTGELTIQISGEDADRFEIVSPPASPGEEFKLRSIIPNGNRIFSIRPKSGSLPGTFEATVTVSGTGETEGGPVLFSASFDVSFTVTRTAGASVSGAPTAVSRSTNSITVNTLTVPVNSGNQEIEYAISRTTAIPTSGWQFGTTFTELLPSTQYYIFARTAENDTHLTGTTLMSVLIHTAPSN